MLYSNTVFANLSLKPQIMTPIIMTFNFLATFGGLWLLSKFGRRPLLIWGSVAMVLILMLIGIFSLMNIQSGSIPMILAFMCAFEFTSGPITWLYMSEIMQDKATGFATGLNWLMACAISALVPYAVYYLTDANKHLSRIGYLFMLSGILTTLGTVFIFYFMKETRGKSKSEIEEMYSGNTEEEIELADDYHKI